MRDYSLTLHNIFFERSETVSGFNTVQAIWDIAKENPSNDLSPEFYAEMIKLYSTPTLVFPGMHFALLSNSFVYRMLF